MATAPAFLFPTRTAGPHHLQVETPASDAGGCARQWPHICIYTLWRSLRLVPAIERPGHLRAAVPRPDCRSARIRQLPPASSARTTPLPHPQREHQRRRPSRRLSQRTTSTSLAIARAWARRELRISSVGEALHGEGLVGRPRPRLCEAHNSTVAGDRELAVNEVLQPREKQNVASGPHGRRRSAASRLSSLARSSCFPTHGSRPAWVLGRVSTACIWLLGGATRTVRQAMASGGRRDSPQ
jgi:hypothetical protein